jgi:hypothetical protein
MVLVRWDGADILVRQISCGSEKVLVGSSGGV